MPQIHVRLAVLAVCLAGSAGVSGCTPGTARAQDGNPHALALEEFGARARAYTALRATVTKSVAPVAPEATPDQIARHQAQLAATIRAARRDARPGDIFTPPVVPQFRTIIRRDLESRDIRDALAAMQGVPLAAALQVNMAWPAGAPRPTVPGRLLADLYALPNGLEYRFLDRHLVLVDADAGLIVDYILDVVPSVVRRKR